MTDKAVEQMARDTLNAFIASGQLQAELLYKQGTRLELDKVALRRFEEQLREYYSTGLYEEKPGKAESKPIRL